MVDITLQNFFKLPLYKNINQVHVVNTFELNPNKKTVLLLIGPSGAGKDTILNYLKQKKLVQHVITCTTRRQRFAFAPHLTPNETSLISKSLDNTTLPTYQNLLKQFKEENKIILEPFDSYVWMREQNINESFEEYVENLVKEYSLIEYDVHHGNVYGLSKNVLDSALQNNVLPVVRTENAGVKTLQPLLSNFYNVIVLAIVPDNLQDIYDRIKMRVSQSGKTDENVEKRFEESKDWILEFEKIANIVLHNSAISKDGKLGLETSYTSSEAFITSLK